ncbi:hypothetical protein ASPVEDRAFT_39071 [Aspergillus versicolor CBS 583.65]|uniref:DUF7703 domain-containing protein n=1 Tax=Aspergillus versicolor CBS 583.65 TaxID=1036611 RepID=A0A1L9PDT9_ASPVE|nr:uncharacterized protein ASPVEDRAFT_39071 [Aspergillus versicolor CBS 583.65]OJI99696.1 hypothetical protein ASPVEDRAFT_39071 [Aspergillus versicolor CBS 583.65]
MVHLHQTPPGLVQGIDDSVSFTTELLLAVFLALALSNSLELITLSCWTFREWRGLYFWCLLISSIGMIPYTIGSILHYWNVAPLAASLPVAWVGFIATVPVQSLILYSRLFLVFYHETFLRFLLDGIIIVIILLVVPNSISMYGSAFIGTPTWNYAYAVTERLQVTGFCVQELFISSIYIWSTVKLLKVSPEGKSRAKKIMYELLAINTITMILDIAVISVEYLNHYSVQVCLKVFVYSVKVKLEFAVLGRLVAITKTRRTKQADRVRRTSFIRNANTFSDFTSGGANGDHSAQRPPSLTGAGIDWSGSTRKASGNAPQPGAMEQVRPATM